jgi:hypothetical protein
MSLIVKVVLVLIKRSRSSAVLTRRRLSKANDISSLKSISEPSFESNSLLSLKLTIWKISFSHSFESIFYDHFADVQNMKRNEFLPTHPPSTARFYVAKL